jgi:hypothetical protein
MATSNLKQHGYQIYRKKGSMQEFSGIFFPVCIYRHSIVRSGTLAQAHNIYTEKILKVHLVLLIPLNLVLDHYTAQFDIYKFYNKLTKKQKHKMHHQYHLQFCTNRYQQFKTRGNIILIYLQWT